MVPEQHPKEKTMSGVGNNEKRRPWKRFVLATGISIAVLLVLFWKTGTKVGDIGNSLRQVNLFILGLTFLISATIHILFGAYKWYLILEGIGCDTTYGEVLFVRMGSDPVRFIMPFKTGELSNIAYFWRVGKLPFARSASWILFDKALNIGGTFLWLVVGLLAVTISKAMGQVNVKYVAIGSSLVVVSVLAFIVPMISRKARNLLRGIAAALHKKLGRIVEELLSTFEGIRPGRKALLLVYGILFQLRPLIVCYLLIRAFGSHFSAIPSIPVVLAWGSVVVAFSNVPSTLWGMGPRETALVGLFGGYAPDAVLISIGLLMAISIHVVPAFFGLPVLENFLATLGSGRAGEIPQSQGSEPPDEETS